MNQNSNITKRLAAAQESADNPCKVVAKVALAAHNRIDQLEKLIKKLEQRMDTSDRLRW